MLTLVLGLGLVYLDLFGMGDVTEAFSVRVFQRLVAPEYPLGAERGAQEDISVVLLRDESLPVLGSSWPLPYGKHAMLLRRILQHQPAAVFVDFLFVERRANDPTAGDIGDAIRRYQERGIPLFFATDAVDPGGDYSVIAGAQTASVTWVDGPDIVPGYPRLVGRDYERTAAFALFDELCGDPATRAAFCPDSVPRISAEEMHVDWAVAAHPDNRAASGEPCPQVATGWRALGNRLVAGFFDPAAGVQADCPYHGTLAVEEILYPSTVARAQLASRGGAADVDRRAEEIRAKVHRLIAGRVVMVGAMLTAVRDEIDSPTHGRIPGVYLHAMALDNLLTYGAHYKGANRGFVAPLTPAFDRHDTTKAAIVATLIILLVALKEHWRRKARRRFESAAVSNVDDCVEVVVGLRTTRFIVGATVVLLATFILAYAHFGWPPIDWLGAITATTIAQSATAAFPSLVEWRARVLEIWPWLRFGKPESPPQTPRTRERRIVTMSERYERIVRLIISGCLLALTGAIAPAPAVAGSITGFEGKPPAIEIFDRDGRFVDEVAPGKFPIPCKVAAIADNGLLEIELRGRTVWVSRDQFRTAGLESIEANVPPVDLGRAKKQCYGIRGMAGETCDE